MDRSDDILSELRGIRSEVARQTALLEAEIKRGDEQTRRMDEMDSRLRSVEATMAARLVGAAGGGGGLVLLGEWLLSRLGG